MTASDPGTPDSSTTPQPSEVGIATKPRTSRLSIAAFVLGLAGVCPPLGFIAMTLGFVAYFRITRNRGRLGGRGYALWALGLGAATTIIWLSVWDRMGTRFLELLEGRMEAEIQEVFVAASEDDPDAIRVILGIEPGGHEVGIQQFIDEVRDGGLEAWSIGIKNLKSVESPFSQPVMDVDVRIDATDQTTWNGVARFVLEPPVGIAFDDLESLVSHPRLEVLKLIGPEGRALRLPEVPGTVESTLEEVDAERIVTPVPAAGGE